MQGNLTKKTRILIVDDEPEIVSTLKDYLLLKGYEAEGMLSGKDALNFLEKQGADVILLDMKMPEISGEDFARIVKEKHPFIKLVVITGYPSQGEGLCKENLLEGLFVKPVRLQQLGRFIAGLEEKTRKEVRIALSLLKAGLFLSLMDIAEQNYPYN